MKVKTLIIRLFIFFLKIFLSLTIENSKLNSSMEIIKNDIGILFDVSGSMKESFDSLSFSNYHKRSNELENIVERICSRGNRLKNEKIRFFTLLFGGIGEPIYDFCNLMEISNNIFNYQLTSNPNLKASKNGFCQKLSKILSEEGKKPLYLDSYLYSNSGPSERLCEMGYYLLKDDFYLRTEIYNSLPDYCKSPYKDIGVSAASVLDFSGSVNERKDKATIDVINQIYQKCINKYAERIIKEDISQRKKNGNKIKFIDGNDLIRMKKKLEKKLVSPNNTKFKILDLFSDYIYSYTPLYTALSIAFKNFKIQSSNYNNKFLFILSDGELNDVDKTTDYISKIKKNAKNNNVTIISIFLTANRVKEEILYDNCQRHFTQGAKDLFLMSSSLNYQHPVIKFLIQKGWNIPLSGECKLFVEVNNSQNLNKFVELINEAIGELNTRNHKEDPLNPNSLMNILSSTFINDYVNSENINKFKVHKQKNGTCYANAISAVICIASSRVYGRPKLIFSEVLQKIIDKYGYHGRNTMTVLDDVLKNYSLHYKYLGADENEARKAIMKTRPCIARFFLTAKQWGNFDLFYRKNPKGILTKEILNEDNYYPNETDGGHAVVLTHISKDYLKFLNSWGTNFGDNGYFKVKSADVLGAYFFDVFWYISDLTKEEINAFNKHMENLKNDINDYIFE